MSARLTCVAPILIGALVLVGPAFAQDAPTAPETQEPSDATQTLMAEYQEVQQRLGQLQVQAIQEHEELELRRSEIDDMVTAAMAEINPEAEAHIARLEVLSGEAMAAQQAQDRETLQSVMAEAATLRSELDEAMAQAIQREDVQAEIQSFEEELMARVVEIDPEAPDLLARMEELAEALSPSGPGDS